MGARGASFAEEQSWTQFSRSRQRVINTRRRIEHDEACSSSHARAQWHGFGRLKLLVVTRDTCHFVSHVRVAQRLWHASQEDLCPDHSSRLPVVRCDRRHPDVDWMTNTSRDNLETALGERYRLRQRHHPEVDATLVYDVSTATGAFCFTTAVCTNPTATEHATNTTIPHNTTSSSHHDSSLQECFRDDDLVWRNVFDVDFIFDWSHHELPQRREGSGLGET